MRALDESECEIGLYWVSELKPRRGVEHPDGSRQLPSDDNIVGYDPPCAPPGAGPIHYQFKLYALDTMLSLPANATREAVLQAMDGHIVGASVYYGTLERLPQR